MSEDIEAVARALLDQHGRSAESVTTDRLMGAVDRNEQDEARHWLAVRQSCRLIAGQDRYLRRVSDKVVWAVEQAIEQEQFDIARALAGVWPVLRVRDKRREREREMLLAASA